MKSVGRDERLSSSEFNDAGAERKFDHGYRYERVNSDGTRTPVKYNPHDMRINKRNLQIVGMYIAIEDQLVQALIEYKTHHYSLGEARDYVREYFTKDIYLYISKEMKVPVPSVRRAIGRWRSPGTWNYEKAAEQAVKFVMENALTPEDTMIHEMTKLEGLGENELAFQNSIRPGKSRSKWSNEKNDFSILINGDKNNG